MSRDKRCQGTKGAKGAWVNSSEGLLRGRVFSRTHFRSSLTPEEGPSCSLLLLHIKETNKEGSLGIFCGKHIKGDGKAQFCM